eukprot:COSAG03_NODE_6102_length_1116_cov_8.535802_1_plen_22_part_10
MFPSQEADMCGVRCPKTDEGFL